MRTGKRHREDIRLTFRTEDRYPTSARVQLHRLDPAPGAGVDTFGACFRRSCHPWKSADQRLSLRSGCLPSDMSDIPGKSLPVLRDLDSSSSMPCGTIPPQPLASRKIHRLVEQLKPAAPSSPTWTRPRPCRHRGTLPPHIRSRLRRPAAQFEIAMMKIYRQLADVPAPALWAMVSPARQLRRRTPRTPVVIAEVVAPRTMRSACDRRRHVDPHPARIIRPASTSLITPSAQEARSARNHRHRCAARSPLHQRLSHMTARSFATECCSRHCM